MSDRPEFDSDIERLSYDLSQANRRISNLEDECDALHEENQELRDRLGEIETQLDAIQDLGREKSTKEEKIAAIVRYAQNTVTGDATTGRVAVTVKTLRGVAGISRRYAYTLIDELPDEYAWLHNRSTVSQYGDLELDRDSQDRALIVDLEALHTNDGDVSKFTTETTSGGASA